MLYDIAVKICIHKYKKITPRKKNNKKQTITITTSTLPGMYPKSTEIGLYLVGLEGPYLIHFLSSSPYHTQMTANNDTANESNNSFCHYNFQNQQMVFHELKICTYY